MSKRLCRWCKARCGGECPEARAASARWAARLKEEATRRAKGKGRGHAGGAALAAAYADPKQHEELARHLFT